MDRKKTLLAIVEKLGLADEQTIAGQQNIKKLDKKDEKALEELAGEGEIIKTKKGKYASLAYKGYVKGELEIKRGGFGFVRCEDGDIFVAVKNLNGALNRDIVAVKRLDGERTGDNQHAEGKVVKIFSDTPYLLTGTFRKMKKCAFVICDDQTVEDIYIPKTDAGGAKDGQKVLIEVTKRGSGKLGPEGRVQEVLGYKGSPGVDILSVARSFGLVEDFPEEVQKELSNLELTIPQTELMRRETQFAKRIFTIDGADAKDLDDAVSIEQLKNGNMLLGVHIADVSHYVRERTRLDREAYHRGTSVYLVDRVIPMLPRVLSNGICSLNPNEIRLTMSCFMEIDARGKVVSHRLAKTAIISKYRMTYQDVNKMLEEKDQTLIAKYSEIYEDLQKMAVLASTLRSVRMKKGSIDFDLDEAKIKLDSQGHPVEIGLRERGTAEKLIEEFMLTCNTTIAEQFFLADLPFLYRVHEVPDVEKIRELGIFLSNFGFHIKGAANLHSKALQDILNKSKGTKNENIINQVVLRSLKKARYSENNAGHFGLAFSSYTHFTSPIRRYPDLVVHRIISDFLSGRLTGGRIKWLEENLPEIASKTSARERLAIDAERQVDDMKKAEYMQKFLGEEFEGVVSGVASSAIFVELPNTVEGVIPLSEMKDDYYVYFKDLYCVIGKRLKRRINLGDAVRVRVKAVDVDAARVEFSMVKPLKNKVEKNGAN